MFSIFLHNVNILSVLMLKSKNVLNFPPQCQYFVSVCACFQSKAQELETVRANNYGFSIGKPSKNAQLLEAADLHIKMGQLERYCEIMLELGEVGDFNFSQLVSNPLHILQCSLHIIGEQISRHL